MEVSLGRISPRITQNGDKPKPHTLWQLVVSRVEKLELLYVVGTISGTNHRFPPFLSQGEEERGREGEKSCH